MLAEHAHGYAELVLAELVRAVPVWKRHALLSAVALLGLLTALLLAGVALMLWAALPDQPMQAPWLLVVVPLLPLVGALACLVALRARTERKAFDDLRLQLSADLAMLREVGAVS